MSLKDKIDEWIGKEWRKRLDQVFHFLWAAIAIFPVVYHTSWYTGALSGLLIDLPRELIDQWPINKWRDTLIDLLFFSLGGATIGLIWG